MKLSIDACTLCGPIRSINQDALLVNTSIFTNQGETCEVNLSQQPTLAIAVADGMGGHKGGEVASRMVLAHTSQFVKTLSPGMDEQTIATMILEWMTQLHHTIKQHGLTHPDLSGMGSTLTGLLFHPSGIFLFHAGDTKLYRLRNGILVQLTRDHNLAGMSHNPLAPKNILLNAIGPGEKVVPDIENLAGKILTGDTLLLCSDGLTDGLTDNTIETLILTNQNISAKSLVEAAIQNGSSDNCSAILLTVKA